MSDDGAVEIYVWRLAEPVGVIERMYFREKLDALLAEHGYTVVASQTGPATLPVVAQLNALARAEATREQPAVPTCGVCGGAMQFTIDMGRVEAGVGGPRPTYMCPNWKQHPANA